MLGIIMDPLIFPSIYSGGGTACSGPRGHFASEAGAWREAHAMDLPIYGFRDLGSSAVRSEPK